MFGTYTVTLDSGATHDVSVDNRDFIAFRRRGYRDIGLSSPDAMSSRIANIGEGDTAGGLDMIELIAWMLWNAGERAGYWSTDYEAFTEKECVTFAIAGDSSTVITADPTQQASVESSVN